jgi:hypothetical protein
MSLAEPRKRPGVAIYTAQCHPNVKLISNYEVVGIELQADWVDLTVLA